MAMANLASSIPDAAVAPVIDPVSLFVSSSGPMLLLVWILVCAAAYVWLAIVIKSRQVRRWRNAERRFERDIANTTDWQAMQRRCDNDSVSLGASVLSAMLHAVHYPDVLEAVAEREVERQNARVHRLMVSLSSIGVAAPLAGLFGTVYGIIHAFLRIGAAQTASLAEIAPAIGEALITTAVGLFAAIPAVISYNILSKQLDDLLAGVDTAARVWAGRLRTTLRSRGQ